MEQGSGRRLRRTALWGVLIVQLSPVNEMARVVVFGIAEVRVGGVVAGAISYGGSTFVIEALASCAIAALLTDQAVYPLVSGQPSLAGCVRQRMRKMVPEGVNVSRALAASVALLAGAAVVVWLWDREQPGRPRSAQISRGLRLSAVLAAVCAVQGAAVARSIELPSPTMIAISVMALGSLPAVAAWVRRSTRTPPPVESNAVLIAAEPPLSGERKAEGHG